MENPIKMDDLGVPLFLETPICHLENGWKNLVPAFCRYLEFSTMQPPSSTSNLLGGVAVTSYHQKACFLFWKMSSNLVIYIYYIYLNPEGDIWFIYI